MIEAIKQHVDSWSDVTIAGVDISKLSGLSNHCYRVILKNELAEPNAVLFRIFAQDLTDRRIEQKIFAAQSESGMGPKLYHQNDSWRIE